MWTWRSSAAVLDPGPGQTHWQEIAGDEVSLVRMVMPSGPPKIYNLPATSVADGRWWIAPGNGEARMSTAMVRISAVWVRLPQDTRNAGTVAGSSVVSTPAAKGAVCKDAVCIDRIAAGRDRAERTPLRHRGG